MPRSGPRTVHRYSLEFKLTAVRLSQQPGIQPSLNSSKRSARSRSSGGRISGRRRSARGSICTPDSMDWARRSTGFSIATAWGSAAHAGSTSSREWRTPPPSERSKRRDSGFRSPTRSLVWPTSATSIKCGWRARPRSTGTSRSKPAPNSISLATTFSANAEGVASRF